MPIQSKQQPPYYTQLVTGIYQGLITQSGTSAPTKTDLINQLNLVEWTRFSAGYYYNLTTTNFPTDPNKIQIIGQTDSFYTPLYTGTPPALVGYIKLLFTDVSGKIEIELNTKNAAGADTDLSSIFSGALLLPTIQLFK